MHKKHNNTLTPNARALRKNMTKQEKHLWYDFLRNYEIRFLRQKVIGQFIVDFYCARAKLVVELDGGQHYEKEAQEYDLFRTRELETYGLKVIRFTNRDVDRNFKAVCGMIDQEVRGRV